MNIKTVVVGELKTNCYIIDKGDSCIIIDPGAEAEKIISSVDHSKKVVGVIVTHSHPDHIGALNEVITKYGCRLFNGSNMNEGKMSIANFTFEVIKTPGHLDDCITIYFEPEKVMFVGDFIFKGSIGRTDLPGGNATDMRYSMQKILRYPLNNTLYPGHYGTTTLADEVNTLNYFMNII